MPNAELAQRILTEITTQPKHFVMREWVNDGADILPKQKLSCGTTMCVAGWAAHLSGFRLIDGGEDVPVVAIAPDGESDMVDQVAVRLLDLPDPSLFFTSEEMAIELLRQLAAGQPLDWAAARATVGDD